MMTPTHTRQTKPPSISSYSPPPDASSLGPTVRLGSVDFGPPVAPFPLRSLRPLLVFGSLGVVKLLRRRQNQWPQGSWTRFCPRHSWIKNQNQQGGKQNYKLAILFHSVISFRLSLCL